MRRKVSSRNFFLRLHPLHRFGISVLLSLLTYFIFKKSFDSLVHLMLLWDVFALSYTILCWIVIINRDIPQIRKVVKQEDGSRVFVLMLVLLTSLASMATVLILLSSKNVITTAEAVYLPIAVAGMMLSWIMVHTIFTFHYAYMYYKDNKQDANGFAGGLNFPDEVAPDYLDFAYFSFVIGMTFQVSDVEISGKKIRRLALLHALLSFALNTFVVALTINVIAGLKG